MLLKKQRRFPCGLVSFAGLHSRFLLLSFFLFWLFPFSFFLSFFLLILLVWFSCLKIILPGSSYIEWCKALIPVKLIIQRVKTDIVCETAIVDFPPVDCIACKDQYRLTNINSNEEQILYPCCPEAFTSTMKWIYEVACNTCLTMKHSIELNLQFSKQSVQ